MAYERILASTALAVALIAGPAQAQKSGGVLKVFFFDSPATMSIHEESTITGGPMMNVFNNLVMYDQSVPPGPRRAPLWRRQAMGRTTG
jgi:hypothetical protein